MINAKQQAGRLGSMMAASLLVAVMAASATGCSFLKPKPKKAFAEACTLDAECDSLDCAGQGGICSKTCQYNKDCGGDLVCRQKDDGSAEHCARAVGAKLNGSCMDPSDCENGHCLKHVGEDTSPGICSRYCQTTDDCPDGMKVCDTISDTGTLKMCLPGGVVAKFGTAPRKATTVTTRPTVTVPPAVTVPPVVTGGTGPILTARSAAPVASVAPTPIKPAVPAGGIKIKPRH